MTLHKRKARDPHKFDQTLASVNACVQVGQPSYTPRAVIGEVMAEGWSLRRSLMCLALCKGICVLLLLPLLLLILVTLICPNTTCLVRGSAYVGGHFCA